MVTCFGIHEFMCAYLCIVHVCFETVSEYKEGHHPSCKNPLQHFKRFYKKNTFEELFQNIESWKKNGFCREKRKSVCCLSLNILYVNYEEFFQLMES